MNFSEIFIRRPIATSLLMVGIAVFGLWLITPFRSAICQTWISPP